MKCVVLSQSFSVNNLYIYVYVLSTEVFRALHQLTMASRCKSLPLYACNLSAKPTIQSWCIYFVFLSEFPCWFVLILRSPPIYSLSALPLKWWPINSVGVVFWNNLCCSCICQSLGICYHRVQINTDAYVMHSSEVVLLPFESA